MRIWPKKSAWLHTIIALILFAGFTLIVLVSDSLHWWSISYGIAGSIVYYYITMSRYLRRRMMARLPFPIEWQYQLEDSVPFYRRIDPNGKRRFEDNVRIFIAEQKIYGLRGAPVPDKIKVLIAAFAAILGHGRPDWEWPTVRDIIVYPTKFNTDYDIDDTHPVAGIVHQQGPIIFSEQDLQHGFAAGTDGINVGLHELAHVMDMADGAADGVPAGLSWFATAPWIRIMANRLQKIRKRQCKQVLRAYAGVNEAEFFAVAVEAFFEQPGKLRRMDQELYELMAGYFNIDPESGKMLHVIE